MHLNSKILGFVSFKSEYLLRLDENRSYSKLKTINLFAPVFVIAKLLTGKSSFDFLSQ